MSDGWRRTVGSRARVGGRAWLLFAWATFGCAWPLEGKPCPCAEDDGWMCCDGVCLRACAAPDGSDGAGPALDGGTERDAGSDEPGADGAVGDGAATSPHPSEPDDAGQGEPPASEFFRVTGVEDMAATNDVLYVSANDGKIHRRSLHDGIELPDIEVGGRVSLAGLDLSSDGRFLAVADRYPRDQHVFGHLIELASGEVRHLDLGPAATGEDGSFMPLFLDDHTLLFSPYSLYSGANEELLPAHVVDLDAEDAGARLGRSVGALTPNARLARCPEVGGFVTAEVNRQGTLRLYGPEAAREERWLHELLFDVSCSRDGTHVAAVTRRGLVVERGSARRIFGRQGLFPLGAVFSPSHDVLYVSWMEQRGLAVEAYSTRTWQPTRILDADRIAENTAPDTITNGHLRISPDGTRLFVKLPSGVEIHHVGRREEYEGGPHPIPMPPEVFARPDPPREPAAGYLLRSGVNDVVHDGVRAQLYVASDSGGFRGRVLAWPGDQRPPTALPLDLRAVTLDLSPDQTRLAVGDGEASSPFELSLSVVTLDGTSVTRHVLSRAPLETGLSALLFLDDHTLLVTSTAPNDAPSVPLRRVDVDTGSVVELTQVGPSAKLARSADGRVVLITWDGSPGSGQFRYDVESGTLTAGSLPGRARDVALDRTGAHQLAILTDAATLFDGAGQVVHSLPVDRSDFRSSEVQSAVFHPLADALYLSWTSTDMDALRYGLAVHDGRDLTFTRELDRRQTGSRLRMSRDGTQLFVIDTSGVLRYLVDAP